MAKKVKMETRTGFVGVDGDGFPWVSATFSDGKNRCLEKCKDETGNFANDIRPVLVIEDTPANRKRLGVKRG